MALDSVHYLPLSVFVLLPSTFIVTYIISVLLHHVTIDFPYISDTGTNTPESCIFSQSLNIVSFLVVLTVYVRYKQIEQYYRDHLSHDSSRIMSINWIGLWVGCISAFGLSIVANFQETSVFRVHMTGAMMCFGFGVIYSWLQSIMSLKMIPLVNSRKMAHFRLLLAFLMTCTFLTSSVCGPLAFKRFHGSNPRQWKPLCHVTANFTDGSNCCHLFLVFRLCLTFAPLIILGTGDDGGWDLHIISTICEWISALSLCTFILTYVREMHLISLSSPRVMFVIESLSMPNQDQSWVGDVDQSLRQQGSAPQRRLNPVINCVASESINDSFSSVNNSIIS